MSISRVTTSYMQNQALSYLNTNMSMLSSLQQTLSSGQKINSPSDDPVGMTQILALSNTLKTDERYGSNIQDAVAEANTADNAINSMVELVQRAQELTTQAANFTNNQDGRNAIALEIDQIINQLVQIGNTDIGGKYIFGGYKTDAPPFSRTGDDVSYGGNPPTESWQRNVEIARGVQLTVNVNGEEMMGESTVNAGPPVSVTGSGIFQTLVQLKLNLEDSASPTQLTDIRSRLDTLTTDMNTILSKQAIIGAVSNRLSVTQDRIDERKSILTQQFASIQDIDMPEVIANINQQQNVFESSLNVTARLMQTSLLSFLR
ncbi:flagellar hook-associated protein FlgL [Vampirovibrio sp.]|uniref:flagellar hook-associated protein FlgL n=1 Tax=Vampirovibrio sp. TaxID=2717857 RepID=UPI00359488D5